MSGVIVGEKGRNEDDTSQDVPVDESQATDQMHDDDTPGQDVEAIKSIT